MAFVSNARVLKSFRDGKDNEALIMETLVASWGGECKKSSLKDDKYKHIDIWWTTQKGNIISIDAKNHISKKGKKYSWIEAQNVFGGKGSIYGEADYIAFNAFDKIYFVKRQKLVDIYENDVKGKEIVTEKPKDYYIPYTRSKYNCIFDSTRKNDDIIFMMPYEDFEKLEDTLIINL